MEIKTGGFELHLGNSISLSSFIDHLLTCSNVAFGTKLIALTRQDSYVIGFFMKIRSMKTYLKRKKEGTTFVVKPETIDKDENFVVVNFFILHTKTGRGLYQYYYGSSSMNQFCEHLSTIYTKYKTTLIDAEKQQIPEDTAKTTKTKVERIIEKKYRGNLKYQIIERKDSFLARVQQLKAIKNFSFDYMHIDPNNSTFNPLSILAKRISHNVTFGISGEKNISAIGNAIASVVSSGTSTKCKVKGIDPVGNEVIYKMFNDHDVFETLDYELVAKSIIINFDDPITSIINSDILKNMVRLANTRQIKAILETQLQ